MASVVFPTRSELLTPELLTEALSELNPGVVVADLRVVEEAHCDTGSASTAARAVLDLDYVPGCDRGLPNRVVLKTVLIRPGAPSSMYRNEVRFYRYVRPELDLETPRVFASSFDEQSGGFGVVMEDVRMRSARFPNATASMSEPQITSALSALAGLHARFWTSPRFSRDLDWLWTPRSGGFHDFMQGAGREFLRYQVGRSEYKQELLVRLGRSFDRAWQCLWKAQEILASEPTTLLHGDTHFGNTYLLPGDRVGLLDWQLVNRGRWCHDVSYIIVTAVDVDHRRRHERELVAYYLDRLRAAGVQSVPDMDDAWLLYRQAAIWGFLIGWMITPVENYGEEILRANLERLTAALEDLDTFAALDG
jgi:aminoglycoside phosphotransferase (APT) family kinase protein